MAQQTKQTKKQINKQSNKQVNNQTSKKKNVKKTTQPSKPSPKKKSSTQERVVNQKRTQHNDRHLALTSMIMGILGLVFLFFPFLGIIFSILAIVFAVSYTKQQKKEDPYQKAGLVMGIVGTAIHVVFFIILIIGILFTASMVEMVTHDTIEIDSRNIDTQEERQEIVEVREPVGDVAEESVTRQIPTE